MLVPLDVPYKRQMLSFATLEKYIYLPTLIVIAKNCTNHYL